MGFVDWLTGLTPGQGRAGSGAGAASAGGARQGADGRPNGAANGAANGGASGGANGGAADAGSGFGDVLGGLSARDAARDQGRAQGSAQGSAQAGAPSAAGVVEAGATRHAGSGASGGESGAEGGQPRGVFGGEAAALELRIEAAVAAMTEAARAPSETAGLLSDAGTATGLSRGDGVAAAGLPAPGSPDRGSLTLSATVAPEAAGGGLGAPIGAAATARFATPDGPGAMAAREAQALKWASPAASPASDAGAGHPQGDPGASAAPRHGPALGTADGAPSATADGAGPQVAEPGAPRSRPGAAPAAPLLGGDVDISVGRPGQTETAATATRLGADAPAEPARRAGLPPAADPVAMAAALRTLGEAVSHEKRAALDPDGAPRAAAGAAAAPQGRGVAVTPDPAAAPQPQRTAPPGAVRANTGDLGAPRQEGGAAIPTGAADGAPDPRAPGVDAGWADGAEGGARGDPPAEPGPARPASREAGGALPAATASSGTADPMEAIPGGDDTPLRVPSAATGGTEAETAPRLGGEARPVGLDAGQGMQRGGDHLAARMEAGPGAPDPQRAGVETARIAAPQIAAAIAERGDHDRILVSLDPPELGRIEIALDFADQTLRASLTADRALTGEMLRRHAEILLLGLADAGFEHVDLNFGAERDQRASDGGRQELGGGAALRPDETGTEAAARAWTEGWGSGLDLRL